jgi:hypothetical protein
MPAIDKLACSIGRRDEVPNQELADELVAKKDKKGIREIAENLWNKDKNIANDCIKVLYEVGYREPGLIEEYADDIIRLFKSNMYTNNRMAWGAMITLATIADKRADAVYANFELIRKAAEEGSVITVDNCIKALSKAASAGPKYNEAIFPFLLGFLGRCRPKSVPQYAEYVYLAADEKNKAGLIELLNQRIGILTPSQSARIRKILKKLDQK